MTVMGEGNSNHDHTAAYQSGLARHALAEGQRLWLYVFDDLTGRCFKVRRGRGS